MFIKDAIGEHLDFRLYVALTPLLKAYVIRNRKHGVITEEIEDKDEAEALLKEIEHIRWQHNVLKDTL